MKMLDGSNILDSEKHCNQKNGIRKVGSRFNS